MRDAIVYGYDWASRNAIERVALALARAGAKVLHCDRVCSLLRRPDTSLREIEPNLFTFGPWMLPSRLNRIPGGPGIQASLVVRQILEHARALELNQPIFLYASAGDLLHSLCKAMKEHGCPLVFVCMDYVDNLAPRHVGQADLALVFSKTAYHRMHARWGERIHHIPHGVDLRPFRNLDACPEDPPALLADVPRPRLGYAGVAATDHLNMRVLAEMLERRPEWSFVSFQRRLSAPGTARTVPLPNAHEVPWQDPAGFTRCVASLDVGFMPYDCSNVVLYNGPPMKLWDYFALGMPVVATPLVHLWEYEDLVYLGETAKELELAVEKALAEPKESPIKEKRKQLAAEHSVEALGRVLEEILG